MLADYLEGIRSLSDIEVNAPVGILLPTDQGHRAWPALRHLSNSLTDYLKCSEQKEQPQLVKLREIVDGFLENPRKCIGKVNELLELIETWLENSKLTPQNEKSLLALIKAFAFMAKALPITINGIPAVSWFLPKDWKHKVSHTDRIIEARYQFLLFCQSNQDNDDHLVNKINSKRKDISIKAKSSLQLIKKIERRSKLFKDKNNKIIKQWERLYENLHQAETEKSLSGLWQSYNEEEDFKQLLCSLALTEAEELKWQKAREKGIKKNGKKLLRRNTPIQLAAVREALEGCIQQRCVELMGKEMDNLQGNVITFFNELLQEKFQANEQSFLQDLYDFFHKELEIIPQNHYTIHSKRLELNSSLLLDARQDLYQLGLLRQNISMMRMVLEEQFVEINNQKSFLEQNFYFMRKLDHLSKSSIFFREEFDQLRQLVYGEYLSLLEEQFVLNRPEDEGLQFESKVDLIEFYYSNLSIMYLSELKHLNEFQDKIDKIGSDNFDKTIVEISNFIKSRSNWGEWFLGLLCPAYRECCEEISLIINTSSLSTIERLVQINHAIKDGMEKLPWCFFFLKARLKSIYENTGGLIFSLPSENKSEIQANYGISESYSTRVGA